MLDDLGAQMEKFIGVLESSLPPEKRHQAVSVNDEILSSIVGTLSDLLGDYDSEAVDFLDRNADLLNTAFPDRFNRIDKAAKAFNFDEALKDLKEAADSYFKGK